MSKFVKKSVTLSRALKEKNRNAGMLARLREQIDKNNSIEQNIPRNLDVIAALNEAKKIENRLISIKSEIAKANLEIVGSIIELEEIKSEIAFWKNLNVKEGEFKSRNYGESMVERFEVVIHGSDVIVKIDELQKKANQLQDELDDFNSSHRVIIEVEEY